MSWTPETVELLKKLWGTGKTASQIAEIIGGITRNSVIGKAHRLGLPSKIKKRVSLNSRNEKLSNNSSKPISKISRRNKFRSLLIEKDFEPENPKQLEELTDNDCKYPIGHPNEKDFYFCGRTSLKDFSYCKLHLLYSYQSKNKKDEPLDQEEIPEFIEKKIKSA